MSNELQGYDWEEAFAYARNPEPVPPGSQVSTAAFDENDIARVIASDEGENDEADWLAAVELKDGRFGFLSAWCDYTGWDCRAGGRAYVAATEADLWQYAISEQEAARLKGGPKQ
jgi:hypothetical protein